MFTGPSTQSLAVVVLIIAIAAPSFAQGGEDGGFGVDAGPFSGESSPGSGERGSPAVRVSTAGPLRAFLASGGGLHSLGDLRRGGRDEALRAARTDQAPIVSTPSNKGKIIALAAILGGTVALSAWVGYRRIQSQSAGSPSRAPGTCQYSTRVRSAGGFYTTRTCRF